MAEVGRGTQGAAGGVEKVDAPVIHPQSPAAAPPTRHAQARADRQRLFTRVQPGPATGVEYACYECDPRGWHTLATVLKDKPGESAFLLGRMLDYAARKCPHVVGFVEECIRGEAVGGGQVP